MPVTALSAGQRQPVAISPSLMAEPKVLLDESTAALGVERTSHHLDLIDELSDHGEASSRD